MNKQRIIRIGVLLSAFIVLTSCLAVGTFAKYATKDSGGDSARVAKFGVILNVADDNSFGTEYETEDEENAGVITVRSSNGEKVIAPGTMDDGNIYFSISGKPEVATKIDISLTVNDEVFLKDGNFTYYPVKFTLYQVEDANGVILDENDAPAPVTLVEGTLADISAFLEAYTNDLDQSYHGPNTDLGAKFRLAWSWQYDVSEQYDEYDTVLGNLAADENFYGTGAYTKETDYNLNMDYVLEVKVTQVN